MPKQRTGNVTWNKQRQAWIARLDWQDEHGQRRCRKRQVENKTRGKELLKKWIAEQSTYGLQLMDGERLTFEQLAERYEKEKLTEPVYEGETKISGLRSHLSLKYCLSALTEHFGKRRVQLITHSDIAAYRARRLNTQTKRGAKRCAASVNRELELLRAILNYAWRSGWLLRNPFSFGDPLISKAQEIHRERILTPEEEERLLAACTGRRAHLRPLLIAALDTAMRKGELLKLVWSDVDLTEGLIRLRATTTKTMKARTVGITARLDAELRKLASQQPPGKENQTQNPSKTGEISDFVIQSYKNSENFLGENTGDFSDFVKRFNKNAGDFSDFVRQSDKNLAVQPDPDSLVFGIADNCKRSFETACDIAKVKDFRFHDCRHTAITRMIQRGLAPLEVMKISGHTQMQTFVRYVNADSNAAKRGAAALDAFHFEEACRTSTEPETPLLN